MQHEEGQNGNFDLGSKFDQNVGIIGLNWNCFSNIQANPPGMQVSFTVVVSFHPSFITRSFICSYPFYPLFNPSKSQASIAHTISNVPTRNPKDC